MDLAVQMTCDISVNRQCELCRQKVTELMHSLYSVDSVDFTGSDKTMKLKAFANPYVIIPLLERYGDHGKINNLKFDGKPITFGNRDYYRQYGGYPYMPRPMPPPYGYPGNYCFPPPPKKADEAKPRPYGQHTARPPPCLPPPPPRPMHTYSYIEPPYWPSSKRGCCVIM